jgi:hypothetical protein
VNSSIATVGNVSAGICGAQSSDLSETETESLGGGTDATAKSLNGGAHLDRVWDRVKSKDYY